MFNLFANWKNFNVLWAIIEPLVLKLARKQVPSRIQALYENIVKMLTPCIESLLKLKAKVKETPNATDDYCFNVGVSILKKIHTWLGSQIDELEQK